MNPLAFYQDLRIHGVLGFSCGQLAAGQALFPLMREISEENFPFCFHLQQVVRPIIWYLAVEIPLVLVILT